MADIDIRNRMLTIGYTSYNTNVEDILDAGYDLAFTHDLEDMTDPSKTIYTITGADLLNIREDARRNGYLDAEGRPMEQLGDRGKYPVAINTALYAENFKLRLDYLREFTKWPYGIHVGGSRNLIEHAYPNPATHSKGYWCHGFVKTHPIDTELTLSQYQIEVWEDSTNELIELTKKTFPSLKMVSTAFACPSHLLTKRNLTNMACGAEIWFMLKRMSLIHRNWYNIFFDVFKETNNAVNEDRFMYLSSSMAAYNIRKNIIIGSPNMEGVLGGENLGICNEAKLYGVAYLAYILGMHGGIIVNDPIKEGVDISTKLDSIKKYKT